jgi:CHAT domain-containing protein
MLKIFASPVSLISGALLILFIFQTALASDFDEENTAATRFVYARTDHAEELKPDENYLRQLKGNEKQFFTVKATAGNCLRFIVEQQGIDVMIGIVDADGKTIKKTDRPSGSFGRETITFLAPRTGVFTIEIKAWLADAMIGKYRISYTVNSSPTEADRKRDLAENLTSEAEELRAEGTRENKEKALEKFSDALKIWQEMGDLYEQAIVYYGMGFTNYGLSNNYEAAILYNRALKLHFQTGDQFGQAVNHAALGAVQYVLNENELAAYNYKKATEIFKELGNVRGLGIIFHGLGTIEMLSGEYEKAIADLTESLRWRVLANDNSGKAWTLITLGKLYLLQKNFTRAEEQFSEAGKILGETRAKKDAELLYNRGRYFLLTGQPKKALLFLAQAIEISKRVGNKLGEANGLIDRSLAEMSSGAPENALVSIERALGLIEELRRSTLDFQTRVAFSATVQPFYAHYISLLMKMHERSPEKGYDKKALEISEQARSRGLLDQLERRALLRRNPANPELLERELSLRDKLTDLLALRESTRRKQVTSEFQEVSARFAEVEAEINRRFYAPEVVSLPTLKAAEIQDNLDEETVLLEYSLTESEGFLWLVSKNDVQSFRLPPGDEIEKKARKAYDCISRPVSLNREALCRQESEELSAVLLNPIIGQIKGKRLVVVKQGFLNYIPFAFLMNPAERKYLIETNEIISLSSASVLRFIRDSGARNAPQKTLAVFADAVYSPLDERIRRKSYSPNLKGEKAIIPRLFASGLEADRIASFVSPETRLVKKNFEVNRDNFFNSDLGNYRVLHFATHAFINDRQPELSSVAFSFYDLEGRETPGLLRPADILRLDLNADLIVLSACQSGLGKQVTGEGIVSLGHSFFAAGAHRLMVSLWSVRDKVTAELMSRFYRLYLKEGKSIPASLREAQIEILRDKRWKSPFYWAAFSLEGDW